MLDDNLIAALEKLGFDENGDERWTNRQLRLSFTYKVLRDLRAAHQ
jgi:hypothetical protein